MSKERELLHAWLCITPHIVDPMYEKLYKTTKEILAQPEQEPEPTTDKQTSVSMAVMPNGVSVSNVYDAYEVGRASVMVEPKREPLDPFKAVQEFEGDYIYKDGFIDGIKYAEKAHGIGEL